MQKIIDTPADRGVFLKIPESVPVGSPATITISVYTGIGEKPPALEELSRRAAEKTARRKASGKEPFDGLYGVLKQSATFAGNPVETVRNIRGEWDAFR